MEFFNNASAVRLQSHHGKYLTADDDQTTVCQTEYGSYKKARWTVEFVQENSNVIRLKSCHGGYLMASKELYLLGATGKKVVQSDPGAEKDGLLEWEPIKDGLRVMLKTKKGKFLRANGATWPWRNSITHDLPHRTATQDWIMWGVDVVDISMLKDQYLISNASSFSSMNDGYSVTDSPSLQSEDVEHRSPSIVSDRPSQRSERGQSEYMQIKDSPSLQCESMIKDSSSLQSESMEIKDYPSLQYESMEIKDFPSLQYESMEIKDSPSLQYEYMEIKDSPSLQFESMKIKDSPTLQIESMKINDSPSFQSESRKINDAPPLQSESMKINDSSSLQSESMEIKDSPSLQSETMEIKDSPSLQSKSMEIKDSPSLQSKSMEIKDSPSLQSESIEIKNSPSFQSESMEIKDSPSFHSESMEIKDSPSFHSESMEIKDSPSFQSETMEIKDSPPLQSESMEIKDSPPLQSESMEIKDSPPLQSESMEIKDSPSLQSESMEITDSPPLQSESPPLQFESMEIKDSPSFQSESMKIKDSPSLESESMKIKDSLSLESESMTINDSPSFQSESMKIKDSPSFQSEAMKNRWSSIVSDRPSQRGQGGMEFFDKVKTVRLQGHLGKYLVADDDQQTVRQSRKESSHRARWTVEFVNKKCNTIRLKSCHGLYLTASSESFLLGWTGKKVIQTRTEKLTDVSIEWEPVKEGLHVKLMTKDGTFLRANGGTPPWRNSVTHDMPQRTATQNWVLWGVDVLDAIHSESDVDSGALSLDLSLNSLVDNFSDSPDTGSLVGRGYRNSQKMSDFGSGDLLPDTSPTARDGGRSEKIFEFGKSTTGLSNVSYSKSSGNMSTNQGGMEFFDKAKVVTLQGHFGKYLVADDDKLTVRQCCNGSSHRARWTVEFVNRKCNTIRLKSCHGLYLTASSETFLLGMTGKKVVQTQPKKLMDVSIEWEPVKEGLHVKLMTKDEKFLRANGGIQPWINSVTHGVPYWPATQNCVLWGVDVLDITLSKPDVDSGSLPPASNLDSGSLPPASSFNYSVYFFLFFFCLFCVGSLFL